MHDDIDFIRQVFECSGVIDICATIFQRRRLEDARMLSGCGHQGSDCRAAIEKRLYDSRANESTGACYEDSLQADSFDK